MVAHTLSQSLNVVPPTAVVDALTKSAPAPRVATVSDALLAPADNPNTRISATGLPSPTAQPTPGCDTTKSSLYCVYTIQSGDTLSSVATRFGLKGNGDVSASDLLVYSNKPDIVSANDLLQIGQQLRIPAANGVIHTVLSSETLSDIATQYGVGVSDITGFPANGISDSNALKIGQELLVPNPTQFELPAPPPTPTPTASPKSSSGSSSSGSSGSSGSIPSASTKGSKASKSGFIWPVSGPISSYFGPSHPLGIDIDLYANPHAAIGAAASGTVTFAGGNPCCSYGLYVVIDHGNGFQTLYAHLSQILVSTGQSVSQGQTIGIAGVTGYSTGPHLHFEVHLNGSVVNPLDYLP